MIKTFKKAKLSASETTEARNYLDEVFLSLKGKDGKKLSPSGLKKLEDNKFEVADLVVTLINDTYTATDPTGLLVQVEEGDIRNNYIFQRRDSALRVVNRSYGTKPLSQRLTFKEFPITTSMKETAVEIPLEELASGRVSTALVTEAIANALFRYRIGTVLDGINAGVTSGADHTGLPGYALRYTGFTQGNLDMAIDGLTEENDGVTVFGRQTALAPTIRTFSGFSPDIETELTTRGIIGVYHGANIVTMRDQFSKVDGSHIMTNKRVWLAGSTPGAIWMQKDVSFLNWTMLDPRTATFGVGVRIEDGILVHDPFQYRIIDIP